jgi:lipopolysaccharide transport system ATP-binding protein
MNTVEFKEVSKKYSKGEAFDCLRDLIPNLVKGLFSHNEKNKSVLGSKEFWALKDVSFELKKGEAFGIVGPNGAGKSTILKLLSRISLPTRGHIKIKGKVNALIEAGAGFHPDLTGLENIYLRGAVIGMKKREIDKKLDAIIAFSELEDFIDTPVKRYSSGMVARLGFSVAAHMNPDILLVDEVLSVGDVSFQAKCIKRMNDFVRSGISVIFISHNLPMVFSLCKRCMFLNKGQVVKIASSDEIARHYYNIYGKANLTHSGRIKVTSFNLSRKASNSSKRFKAGERAKLSLDLEADCNLENVVLSFFVKCHNGIIVFDASSNNYGKTYTFIQGQKKKVEINFRVNLPQGQYFIGINLASIPQQYYFYRDELQGFYVSAPKTYGQSFLDIEWN